VERYQDEQGQWWIKFPTTTRRRAEVRTCEGCGEEDVALKTSKGRFCGQSCGGRFASRQQVRKRGTEHYAWKGGRVKWPGGYMAVRVDVDGERKYVLEHRYVMEQHLGRRLERNETVHHLNGIRDDNRIENLQLRNGRHGKGAAHRCLDCGSTNIEAVALD